MKKIRIGQIGIEHNHGEGKMNSVRNFPELFEIVGIAEKDSELINKNGSLPAYRDLNFMGIDELLSKDLDAALIETGVKDLIPAARKCIDAGVSVHLDKPAGESLKEFVELLNTAKAKNLTVQLGYMYRYNPAVKKCIEAVKAGMLGEIFSINAEMSTCHTEEYRKWLNNFKGGTMHIFGCHLIDLIVTILGKPQSINSFNKCTGFGGVIVRDNCFAVFDYKNAHAKVTAASVEVNGWGRRQFVVCGSKGTIEIKPLELPALMSISTKDRALNVYADIKEHIVVPEIESLHRYDDMMLEFYNLLNGGMENPYAAEHEVIVQDTLLKACGL